MTKNSPLLYIEILRPGHWFKNIVVVFGSIAAIYFFGTTENFYFLLGKIALALLLACLVSSVNYAINNITDEVNDSFHPVKKNRALPNKNIFKYPLYFTIFFLLLISLTTAKLVFGNPLLISLIMLFVAGLLYNVRPLRFKDIPFLDVITESVNNPIRLLTGWLVFSKTWVFPPVIYLLFFWVLGAAFMSAKRYAELNFFLSSHREISPSLYRKSYKIYSLRNLYLMVLTYLTATTIFFIILSVKYDTKLLLILPVMIGYFVWFLRIMKEKDSPFREPESVFSNKPVFSAAGGVIIIGLITLFFS